MAKITEYSAPDRRLSVDEKGYSAFETAGRRVGPLYNQAGNDERDIGRLEADINKQRMWPWDFLIADARQSQGGGGGSGGGGGGFKTQGSSSDPFGSFGNHGQASRGAGALGQLFNGTPTNGRGKVETSRGEPGGHAKLIDGYGRPVEPGDVTILRGDGRNTGGLLPVPPDMKNPYAPFGSTPYGYQQPPLIPGVDSGFGGNPTPIDDLSYGKYDMVPNPNPDPSGKGATQIPVWSPQDYGGGREPGFFDNPVQNLKDWITGPDINTESY